MQSYQLEMCLAARLHSLIGLPEQVSWPLMGMLCLRNVDLSLLRDMQSAAASCLQEWHASSSVQSESAGPPQLSRAHRALQPATLVQCRAFTSGLCYLQRWRTLWLVLAATPAVQAWQDRGITEVGPG